MEKRINNILARTMVLVPAFNEEASLPDLLQELSRSLPQCDVCVVDDGSQDQTAAVARAAGARVLRLPCNCGVGVAVQTGFIDALERGYDYLLRLDGDGQHPPAEAVKLVRRMAAEPTDLVIGTRYGEGSCYHGTPFRRVTLKVLATFVSLICRKKSTDPTSGFWLVSRPLLFCFALHYPSDYPEAEALALLRRQGFSYEEVPVIFRPRKAGASSIHAWGSVLFALKVFLALFVDRLRSVDVRGRPHTLRESRWGVIRKGLVAGCFLLSVMLLVPLLLRASQMTRIRMLMAGVSMGVFVITLLTIRCYKLREKYAILWLTTAAMITLVAFFPDLVERVRLWFGMQYVTSLVAVIFVFLVLVSFHFSIALSSLNDKVSALAGRSAILEAHLHALTERVADLETEAQADTKARASRNSGIARSG